LSARSPGTGEANYTFLTLRELRPVTRIIYLVSLVLKLKTMKTKITLALIALSFIALSFKLAIDKTSGTVEQVEGLYVFIYSKPSSKYDVSGSVKGPFVVADNIEKRIKTLVLRVKDKYPSAEGAIITNDLSNAEAIRFKE